MRTKTVVLVFTFLPLCVIADNQDFENSFKVVGKYHWVESNMVTDSSNTNDQKARNLESATIEITHDVTSAAGDIETIVLASGKFVHGTVVLTGIIETPTKVHISVQGATEKNLSKTALLVPGGSDTSFAVVERADPYFSDFLVLVGTERQTIDTERKFIVSGNLDQNGLDLSMARIDVRGTMFENGNKQMVILGYVMLENDKFLIEGEIDEPQAVTINLDEGSKYWSTPAIIQPGAHVTISWHGATQVLLATATKGRHINLVESWQRSKEYLDKVDEVAKSVVKAKLKPKTQQLEVADLTEQAIDAANTNSITQTASEQVNESTESNSSDDENTDNEVNFPKMDARQPAVGCEHVSMDAVQMSVMDFIRANSVASETGRLRQEQFQIQKTALQNSAKISKDPLDSLLAMELGAYRVSDENRNEAFPIFERLSRELDPEIVARRVTPLREDLARKIAIETAEYSLIQGQKVPAINLANLAGEDSSLYEDILGNNELVLIDFWASWCGPCIDTFPALKDLYSIYHDKGFDIVSISLDSELVDWSESSIEHQLPWVNLGEIKGMQGPTAVNFGVQFIPKSYLVDTEGCILKKDLHAEQLKNYLAENLQATSP